MPHVQANLDNETFKEVKKDAIDKDVTLGDYVKDALKAHLKRGSNTEEAEAQSGTDKLN
jgi:hypothetical protein